MYDQKHTLQCPDCEHAVVAGVACDWQPEQCPHVHSMDRENRAQRAPRSWNSYLLYDQALEFDAVRGED